MTDSLPTPNDSAPGRLARQDSLCDRFETTWRAGRRPRLEQYLGNVSSAEQPELLRELLVLELWYRYQHGEQSDPEEYHQRFPQHAEVIDAVFHEVDQTTPKETKTGLRPPELRMPSGAGDEPRMSRREEPGLIVLGDYELLNQLGRGGMGVVYRARQRSTNRIVALKLIRPDLLEHLPSQEREDWLERFQREAQIAAALEHDCVVTVYEVGKVDGQHFYSMRLIEGQSLAEILRTGPVPNRRGARYVEQVARALHALHRRGIVHRDLKPRNILIDASGRAYVTDFGLARWSEQARELTHQGTCIGTPEYMAPEQARNPKGVEPAGDVYSLGATLYALLTGRPPFQAADSVETLRQVQDQEPLSPRRLNPAVHRDLALICLKCLEKEPRQRYASALQVADELRRYLNDEPLRHTRAVGKAERVWRWCRRKPALAAVSSLAVVALMAGVISASLAVSQWRALVLYQSHVLQEQQLKLAEAALDKGLELCRQGKVSEGMLRLAHSLELAPEHAPGLERVSRMNLASWRRLLSPLRAVFPHPHTVLAVAFSPDGQTLFTVTRNQVQRWEVATGQRIGEPVTLQGDVLAAAFSPDRKTLLTGCADKSARRWELATGRPIGPLLPHQDKVQAVAFSPDGRTLLTGGEDQTAQLWDADTGQPIGPPLRHGGQVLAVAFRPDGQAVLTAGLNGEARIWNVATGQLLAPPLPHKAKVSAIAYSPDGKRILTGSAGGNAGLAQIWDAATGKPLGQPFRHESQVHAVVFSPDGQRILTGSYDQTVRLWEVASGRPIGAPLSHQGMITSLTFSPDGTLLLSGSADATARLWEAAPTNLHRSPLALEKGLGDIAISPDGHTIVTGSLDGKVQLWDLATGESQRLYPDHRGPVRAVAFRGTCVLTGSADATARLWEVPTGKWITLPHSGPIGAVALSPDGKTAVTASEDRTRTAPTGGPGAIAQLWNTSTGERIGPPLRHHGDIYRVAFRSDGRAIVTASEDGTAQVWDAATGEALGPRLKHEWCVFAAAFNADGTRVLTGSADGTARLWEAGTGTSLIPPLRHLGSVHAVAFSPDDRLIVTGSRDKTARLWETGTGKARAILQHEDIVRSVAFSSDGLLVLTGSDDKSVRLWDAATGKPCGPPLQHPSFFTKAVFSPDGKTIVTGGTVNAAWVWAVPVPLEGTKERMVLWTKVCTGMELDHDEVVQAMDVRSWLHGRQRLQELGGAPAP